MTSKVKITTTQHEGRTLASSGSPWEGTIGYSRAVRVRDQIHVTGTVGVEADGKYAPTLAGQSRRAFTIIAAALEALGGKLSDVVRTRIYVTDISQWQAVGSAHAEVFGSIRPATTMVEVAKLIDDAALIEIEADAYVA
jgi:enamine deaminase RidA (YjgF/YER057c/UK114 family)